MSANDFAHRPRVCACVMMNHPFPANLPLLRRLYAGRFAELLFLIPFAELDDPDVITVYRGSYAHAAYVTDARARLAQVECDYFLFIHDDVLLNPQFDEANFAALFPLGPDDGFIPWVYRTPERLGDWIWYYSLLPKLLHPKSLLFGSGIEPANLIRYLPDADAIRAGYRRSGAPFTERVVIDLLDADQSPAGSHPAAGSPAVVMIDGLAARLDHESQVQQAIDERTLAALRDLTHAMGLAARRDGHATDDVTIELPIPLTASAYYTDCYIVPRSRFDRFAHYMGVAGAAGLFVEIIVPVILHAVCERVLTAAHLGLDFSGFQRPRKIDEFTDRRVMATHPFKFSMFREPAQQDGFMAIVDALRSEQILDPAMAVAAGLDPSHTDPMRHEGWHGVEAWGRWASASSATIRLNHAGPSGVVRLGLVAPTQGGEPAFGGWVSLTGGALQRFSIVAGTDLVIEIEATAEAPVSIEIRSDRLLRPRDRDASLHDDRALGVGLVSIHLP